ncbi:D-alanyl-D-alanine carboxypeptidase family protein [Halobacillus litoralis]|uniref:D-alanyl-D-alanine carboxypeptidase family protein n=1 Tax=Halobacillus litoralis TaxID=45668 RepID=UPI001CD58BDD|nr:D-alanyl-D-alanine carboxypeptidase family protein [Halobacillus litoralis]MCA1022413.1 D-alanyl-D-alanine carboxypeptidase [Halobacillus litoralis]
MKKLTMILTLIILTANLGNTPVYGASKPDSPDILSESAIVLEAGTGKVLYEKNADRDMYPASLTKIATAIYALENGNPEDQVTVSEEARNTGGSSVFLMEGEQVSLKKLVQGLLINSGNDAGTAIAEHMSGSVDRFSEDLNAFLEEEVGAESTHFTNPHGLYDGQHTTTARDLAVLTQYAMQNETFMEIFGTKTMEWTGESWDTTLYTHHKLFREDPYEGITGGKTGFVPQAGFTLATTAAREDTNLIAITMKTPNQDQVYTDTKELLDYGFENYETSFVQKEEILGGRADEYMLPEEIPYTHLKEQTAEVSVDENGKMTITSEDGTLLTSYQLEEKEKNEEVTTVPKTAVAEKEEDSWTDYLNYLIIPPKFWALDVLHF